MLQSYFKIGWRNLINNKGYSFVNIAGLATGITVVLLISLWIWDEVSWDASFANRDRIAQIWQHNTLNNEVNTSKAVPWVMAEEIRNTYGSDFKYVVQSTWTDKRTLAHGEIILNKGGKCMEPQGTELLELNMLSGTRDGLKDTYSILISASTAKAFFGDGDAMNQIIRIGKSEVKVTGVYEDFPQNSSFSDVEYLLPWDLNLIRNPWMKEMKDPWTGNFSQTFVMLADNADMNQVSLKIKDVKLNRLTGTDDAKQKPELFLHPMSRWHLYSEFKDGKNIGGQIQFVMLFGSIGIFILLLACINFMNLSTARSEKRAKEVGIRKSMGSVRGQLMMQFFSESVLLSFMALAFALIAAQLLLPMFNQVGGKQLTMPWGNPVFWILSLGFCLVIGLIAGSYPALFLSSFQPVKALKSTFRTGSSASIPRKVLVIFQFGISTVLIVGTLVVYNQVQFAKNRSTGYNRSGLLSLGMRNEEIHNHLEAVRQELMDAGAILNMAESGSALTDVNNNNSGFDWKGKDPALAVEFANTDVSMDYGKTIGWKIKSGRDFSREFKSDSAAFIVNEAAVRLLGFKEPIGETLVWNDTPLHIIGVVEDVVMESPYEPVRPSLFYLTKDAGNIVFVSLPLSADFSETLSKVESVFKKYNTTAPFEYQFVDQEYDKKFGNEERIGKLSGIFAGLAIFISCLGIFALASYMSEQRTKEIGVRKVLGASEINLWGLLSRDFMTLVGISLLIAIPSAYLSMSNWLQQFAYRTDIKWWMLVSAGVGTLAITLITVSYQSIKAARANPVKSLRSE